MYKVTSKIRFDFLLGGGGTGEYRSVKVLVLAYVMQSLLLTTQIIKLILMKKDRNNCKTSKVR